MKSKMWLFGGFVVAALALSWSCTSYPPTSYGSGVYPNRYATPGFTATPAPTFEATPAYVGGWLVNGPNGLAQANGSIYVAEGDGASVSQVQVFNSTGGSAVTQWSSYSTGTTVIPFQWPNGLAINSTSGNMYVLDSGNGNTGVGAVYEFGPGPTYSPVTTWTSYNSTTFSYPGGIAVDGTGNVYVADLGNELLEEFSSTGTPMAQWSSSYQGYPVFPIGVAVDGSGNIYVADGDNGLIWKLTSSGSAFSAAATWALPAPPAYAAYYDDPLFYSLSVDGDGNLLVADYDNSLVEVYTPTGTLLAELTGVQTGATVFGGPSAVLFYNNDFYVGDYDVNTLGVTNSAGNIQYFGPVSY
jgi:sugar lactone lactonase YvrE